MFPAHVAADHLDSAVGEPTRVPADQPAFQREPTARLEGEREAEGEEHEAEGRRGHAPPIGRGRPSLKGRSGARADYPWAVKLPHPLASAELAALVGGVHHGAPRVVTGAAPADSAGPDDLAYLEKGAPGGAGVLLSRTVLDDRTCIVVDDPLAALVRILATHVPDHRFDAPAEVHPTAVVHPGVVLGAGVVVGEGAVLFPHVVVYPGVRIGPRSRVHAGAVLGADGFRFHPTRTGLLKVPQVGGVRVGADVEIGALSTVDRGFLDDTVIGDGCKLDNMVHVAHNCRLGRFVVVAAQTGISGSCTLGDGVILGGQVGVVDHVVIGAGARVGAGSGVHADIPAGETWLGSPARPIAQTRRIWASWKYLPELVRKLG